MDNLDDDWVFLHWLFRGDMSSPEEASALWKLDLMMTEKLGSDWIKQPGMRQSLEWVLDHRFKNTQ